MKRFFAIFLIGIAVAAGVLFANGRNEPEAPELPTERTAQAPVIGTDILLINASNPLPNGFRPDRLVNLYEQENRCFQLSRADIALSETVLEAMNAMFAAAQRDGVSGFIINSGYRSYSQQAEVYANATEGIAARPGTSEHETGLAFDVTAKGKRDFELTPQFAWLSKHCGEYGFILRYPKGQEHITGYPYEPWHYRYIGLPHSKAIMDMRLTLEEYLGRLA